jgi:putative copper export protein
MDWVGFVRVIHVVLGVFWAGAMFFFVLFLEPSLRALGPEGGKVMQALQQRRFLGTMLTVGALTLLTGLVVFWRFTAGFSGGMMRSAYAHSLLLGAAAGAVTLGIGLFVTRPTVGRIGAIAASGQGSPPSPGEMAELERLRARLRVAARSAAALLLLSVIAMAGARYL